MGNPAFQQIFPLAIFSCVLVFFVLAEYFNRKEQKRALKALAQQFGGTCSKFFLSCSFKGEFQGRAVGITYQPPRKNTPAYLRIFLKQETRLKLRIYKESAISRLGERLGVVREVKTGDEQFDNDFLIFSNSAEQVQIYLSSFDKKNIVRELFERGFDSLIMDGKKFLVTKPYPGRNDSVGDLSILKVKDVLELMFKLIDGAQ